MAAVTLGETARQVVPNLGLKMVSLQTNASAATSDTIDASTAANGAFYQIYGVYIADNTGAVKTATWSGLSITLGTISTGIHNILIWGV